MDESASGSWTNHHSIIEFNDQWYLFYHDKDLSPDFDKNRSAKIDSLFFNEDGTIQKVIPTFRGVGLSSALQNIEIDRYSQISESGASVAFLDTADTFKGWKTRFDKQNAWISYNKVDFGNKKLKTILVKANSPAGSTLQIRLDNPGGMLLAEVKIPAGTGWSTVTKRRPKYQKGVHNLFVVLKDNNPVEVDWIRFK